MSEMRILITGSRRWTNAAVIRDILTAQFETHPDAVLVHGGAVGADTLAGMVWTKLGGSDPEVHRADWAKFKRAAGPVRNQEMVDAGADVCLAFLMPDSFGTEDCVRRARKAGIKVYEFRSVS